jgi:c-di-GMP-binding flagellar brake protein YcgR
MSSGTQAPNMQKLSQIVEALGPITGDDRDTWLGKRAHRRSNVILPVRLRVLGASEKPSGPAFAARSRDISANGLGLTVPEELDLHRQFQVEVFTVKGTWAGRMRLVHCTQTIGGYKVGLVCADSDGFPVQLPAEEELPAEAAAPSACTDDPTQVLTLEQAREEVRQAVHRYQLAESTWGLLGNSMKKELKRLLENFPEPQTSRIDREPRRSSYRHDVEGSVHLLVSTPGGYDLITTQIADISEGGARILLSANPQAQVEQGQQGWTRGIRAAVGIWTPEAGTLWIPAQIVHDGSPLFNERSVGLQFIRAGSYPLH